MTSSEPKWRDIRRKIKNNQMLTDDEQRKLDKWTYIWIFISIAITLPVSITSITLWFISLAVR